MSTLFDGVFSHSLCHSREVKNTNIEWDFSTQQALHIVLGGLHDNNDNDHKIGRISTYSDLGLGGVYII